MSDVTFAKGLATAGPGPVEIDVSTDLEAFTLTCSDYQVAVNNGAGSPGLITARWEWFAIPLDQTGAGAEVRVTVSAFATVASGARASLLLCCNGGVDGTDIPETDGELTPSVTYYTSELDREIRVAIGVVVGGDADAAALVSVTAVDGEIHLGER